MAQKQQGSEERNIWPHKRRLDQLRREGNVPLSRDFQTAMTMFAVVVYILLTWRSLVSRWQAGFLIVDPAMPGGFAAEAQRVVSGLSRLALETLGPIAAVAIGGALLGAILDSKGFVVQIKALAPDFTRLSPAEGFSRVFSLRNLIDMVKGLVVISIVVGGNLLLLRAFFNDLLWAPSCGLPCTFKMLTFVIGGSIAIGLVVMLALAFTDLPLSRWQFRRENKMSISEFKRQQKDDEGDPDFRRERRKLAKQSVETAGQVGLHRAMIILTSGDAAVALTYTPGVTQAPVITARTRTDSADFVRRAMEMGLPISDEPDLVPRLVEHGSLGGYVPLATFTDVARVLIIHGIIKP